MATTDQTKPTAPEYKPYSPVTDKGTSTPSSSPTLPTLADYSIDTTKQTVQGQLDNILNQNNPLMQKAAAKGMQYANSRGLLNSSIGAGAAQSALMDYAMPIAQADAGIQNQFAMAKYNTDLDLARQKFGTDLQQSTMGYQDTLQRGIMDKSDELAYRQMQYSDELQRGIMDAQNFYQKDILANQEDINTRNLAMTTSANTQGEYLGAIDTIIKEAMVSVNEIETTEGITAEDKTTMINNTIARRDADLAFMKSLYSNMPTWDFSWVDIETMPDAPGVTLPEPTA